MPLIELSRFYPATAEETYRALAYAVSAMAKEQTRDDFAKAVSFATKMTAWASGANISAYVVPEGDGARIRMEGQAKMRSQVNADNAAHKQLNAILDYVSQVIVHYRSNS